MALENVEDMESLLDVVVWSRIIMVEVDDADEKYDDCATNVEP